jgi:hypothetical protein
MLASASARAPARFVARPRDVTDVTEEASFSIRPRCNARARLRKTAVAAPPAFVAWRTAGKLG